MWIAPESISEKSWLKKIIVVRRKILKFQTLKNKLNSLIYLKLALLCIILCVFL